MNSAVLAQDRMSSEERAAREDLASLYHIFRKNGWVEHIYNHITARVPGPARHFLINSFGLTYGEVTPANLVKIDLDGEKVDGAEGRVNLPGFTIHSAIHSAREEAHYIAHTHTTEGLAVACTEEGLSHHSFYGAMLYDQIAYHDFEGISTEIDERERLVASLGDKDYMILRHHGLLVVGATASEALFRMGILQRACEIQVASAVFGSQLRPIPQDILRKTAIQMRTAVAKGFDSDTPFGMDAFLAYQRELAV